MQVKRKHCTVLNNYIVLYVQFQITFQPPIADITKKLFNTLDYITFLTKSLPKFDDMMKIKTGKKIHPLSLKLSQNVKCRELQNLLSQGKKYSK